MLNWLFGKKKATVLAPPSKTEDQVTFDYVNNLQNEEITPKAKMRKVKYKVQHYSNTPDVLLHPNEKPYFYKVLSRSTKNFVKLKTFFKLDMGYHPLITIKTLNDLNITIKFHNSQEITIRSHEALDLALALMKYNEIKGEGSFVKTKAPNNG
jgi:hypothetical protein